MDPFESHRAELFAIAYRMCGSRADADDLVSECWLRWAQADQRAIERPRAWLSTVIVRLCLDERKSARATRQRYVGPWLPEPLPTDERAPDAHEKTALAESVSTAFLLVLESLSPVERAVLLLHDVFEYEHDEVAAMLGRTSEACRQSLHRARERLRERRPRFAPTREQHAEVLLQFSRAIATGDTAGLTALFAPDAVVLSDSDGKARAARRPVHGADRCARLLVGLAKKGEASASVEIVSLNGALSLVVREAGEVTSTLSIETDGHRVFAVHIVRNPAKLMGLRAV
jgi:RNA polymerase sigma-70 factor (ECF subfamily)